MGDRDNAGTKPWGVAQILDTHPGKTLRIRVDGKPAPGNPYLATPGALPEIWNYGLRSPEGLAFAPDGKLWETEHGPRGGDEVNILGAGRNYGWPLVTHGIDYKGKPVNTGASSGLGLEEPVYYWSPSLAPSGMAFYRGDLFPQWKHSIFVPMLRGNSVERLTLADDKVIAEEPLLTELHTRIRDVRVGPDGAVYVLTDSGGGVIGDSTPATSKLVKLTPK
jgi:glucose/arabinose dehydrogenase